MSSSPDSSNSAQSQPQEQAKRKRVRKYDPSIGVVVIENVQEGNDT
jgi:hypothetical protein